jgi:hypothetical protein
VKDKLIPELNTKDVRTVGLILIVAVVAIAMVLLWASRTISAQEKPPESQVTLRAVKEYKLTEVQLLRLQVTQKDAFLLKAQMQDIQRQFQEKVTQLMSEATKIKMEQGWPPETVFNPDNLTFSAPPPKEEKKP